MYPFAINDVSQAELSIESEHKNLMNSARAQIKKKTTQRVSLLQMLKINSGPLKQWFTTKETV